MCKQREVFGREEYLLPWQSTRVSPAVPAALPAARVCVWRRGRVRPASILSPGGQQGHGRLADHHASHLRASTTRAGLRGHPPGRGTPPRGHLRGDTAPERGIPRASRRRLASPPPLSAVHPRAANRSPPFREEAAGGTGCWGAAPVRAEPPAPPPRSPGARRRRGAARGGRQSASA